MVRCVAETRTYLAECYSPGIDRDLVTSCGQRASAAASELTDEGLQVEYLGALLVPGDEVVFHLFAASSPADVREASTRAGVEFERVLDLLPVGIHPLSVTSISQSVGAKTGRQA
jgi:hypothetical protein